MIVLPAIDIKDGQCVRLYQGDFERLTTYEADPVQVARRWQDAGASWLHVVDLDGALNASRECAFHVCQCTQTAADLNSKRRFLAHACDQGRVDRMALFRAIQIHHMQPARTRLLPALSNFHRIASVNRHLAVIALVEAYTLAVFDINCWKKLHWRTHLRKFRNIWSPISPLFSG